MLGQGSISAESLLRACAANKANGILGCIKSNMTSTTRGVIIPCFSALLRWHLDYRVPFWDTWYKN